MKKNVIENITVTLRKADGVLYPVKDRKDKVMIVLSGSEGGLAHAKKLAKYLQTNGIPALALGYFKTANSVKSLSKIELENIKEAIDWLKQMGYKKIGIEGYSKGAEYAAAAAIAFHELSCVILKTPSWFYSEGMNRKTPSKTSCWSYKGRELPYTPYKTRKLPIIKEIIKNREYNILAINMNKKINPDSIISIEKIKAPILMFSTKMDTIWPSKESCEKLEERLISYNFFYPYKHICFEYMSHMMLEDCEDSIKYFIKSEKRYPKECARERTMMGQECIRWIEEVWQ
ncbi:acyl-CoA thioester hydrolase/BAAT C-terminal domain-containing protein [Massilicoli timonensis]|uniref:acyl-CoA thioester hydrolase/BAAT C-terminal domain-containing protein n=1 Tax=Massilicoli timonensis TaxID=2015901 RepID=UPI000C862A33|nr:acyl-CoA thioester hydrolase/BAAT C-terminal domain-containing protein [Massilicoli timonensis]